MNTQVGASSCNFSTYCTLTMASRPFVKPHRSGDLIRISCSSSFPVFASSTITSPFVTRATTTHAAVRCTYVLHCATVWCSVMQRVAVCCSLLSASPCEWCACWRMLMHTQLDGRIQHFAALKELILDHNRVVKVSPVVYICASLRCVSLHDNPLTNPLIEPSIRSLPVKPLSSTSTLFFLFWCWGWQSETSCIVLKWNKLIEFWKLFQPCWLIATILRLPSWCLGFSIGMYARLCP